MLAISAPALADTAMHANHVMPGQLRVTQIDGATVYDAQNRNIGDVKDIILDRDGRVASVVLDVGSFLGMGGKFVAISMADMKVTFDNNNPNKPRLTVDMTKEQLKSAQAFDLNAKDRSATGSSTPPPVQRESPAPASAPR
jgi:hypothetical protein